MEEPLILVTWLWSEFHGLILWMIGFYALWHLVVKPILRTIDNAREAKEDRINDRHIELINKLTDIETAIEVTAASDAAGHRGGSVSHMVVAECKAEGRLTKSATARRETNDPRHR